jgi:uncharacterized metal-binding protein YceD (DUF177 family)
MADAPHTPEFSHPMRAAELDMTAQAIFRTATPPECRALAKRFGLVSMHRFEIALLIHRDGDTIHLSGEVGADVLAACVATGDPVPMRVTDKIAMRFVPETEFRPGVEIEVDSTSYDIAEYDGRVVDVGEAAAQSLALAIPPFPRSSDAAKRLRAAGIALEGDRVEEGSLGALLKRTLELSRLKGEKK